MYILESTIASVASEELDKEIKKELLIEDPEDAKARINDRDRDDSEAS